MNEQVQPFSNSLNLCNITLPQKNKAPPSHSSIRFPNSHETYSTAQPLFGTTVLSPFVFLCALLPPNHPTVMDQFI